MLVSVVYLTYQSKNMTRIFHARSYDRFIEIKSNLTRNRLQRINQGSSFFGSSFSFRLYFKYRAQPNWEEKENPSILKDDFSSKNSSVFTLLAVALLDWSNKTCWVSPPLKSASHFLPKHTVSRRSGSSLGSISGCCHKSGAWSHLQ